MSSLSTLELNAMRDVIENMGKFNQIEILKILNKNKDVVLNENKYGIHVNLTELKQEVIDELNVYINYVTKQEVTLNEIEKQKEDFKNIYFAKDINSKPGLYNKNTLLDTNA
jgi:hypothetical protein